MANKKFVVTHPKLYMKVGSSLRHIETGTEIALTEGEAKSLLKQGKILAQGSQKKVNVGGDSKPKVTDNTDK